MTTTTQESTAKNLLRPAGADGEFVSVVIPCYNEERFIGKALEQLVGQYETNHFEIIVVDGMSEFCASSHAATARELFGDEKKVVDCVINDVESAPITPKMKALLNIAGKVQQSGKNVLPEDVSEARKHGAGDRDIHDTVLIAATFSMFNRYVDGLASLTPTDPKAYEEMGKRMSTLGYVLPKPQ